MSILYKLSMILFLFFTTGCATIMTIAAPPVYETKPGRLITGDSISFNYSVKEDNTYLVFEKQPLCVQQYEIIHFKRKRLDGIIPAIVEIPFYGFGIGDLATAETISIASKEETHREIKKTSMISICGSFESAPGEDIMIQFADSLKTIYIQSDAGGKIPLSVIRDVNSGLLPMNVFIITKAGPVYIGTFDRDVFDDKIQVELGL